MPLVNEINAGFEAVGALLAWHSVSLARRTKPQGVSTAMVAFSGLWAIECGPYYLAHGDIVSASFAAVRCVGLLTWSWLAVRR